MFNRIISLGDSVTRALFFLQNKPNTLTNTIYNMNIERFVCSVTFFLNLSTLHRCCCACPLTTKKNHKIIANSNANPGIGTTNSVRCTARKTTHANQVKIKRVSKRKKKRKKTTTFARDGEKAIKKRITQLKSDLFDEIEKCNLYCFCSTFFLGFVLFSPVILKTCFIFIYNVQT